MVIRIHWQTAHHAGGELTEAYDGQRIAGHCEERVPQRLCFEGACLCVRLRYSNNIDAPKLLLLYHIAGILGRRGVLTNPQIAGKRSASFPRNKRRAVRLGPNLVEYEPGLVHLTYLSRIA